MNLTNLENRKEIANLELLRKKQEAFQESGTKNYKHVSKYCGHGEIENEIYFFFECRNYDALQNVRIRKDTFQELKEQKK